MKMGSVPFFSPFLSLLLPLYPCLLLLPVKMIRLHFEWILQILLFKRGCGVDEACFDRCFTCFIGLSKIWVDNFKDLSDSIPNLNSAVPRNATVKFTNEHQGNKQIHWCRLSIYSIKHITSDQRSIKSPQKCSSFSFIGFCSVGWNCVWLSGCRLVKTFR